MQTSLWSRFQQILPVSNIIIGSVTAHNADGTSSVTTAEGYSIRPIGTTVAVTLKCYVRDGRIIGQAPSLPVLNATV
jgi:hypothetical protein